MKLVTVLDNGRPQAGLLEGEDVFVTDVNSLERVIGERLDLKKQAGQWKPLKDLRLDAPLRPPIVWATGSNYHDHVGERNDSAVAINMPKRDLEFFVKAGQSIATLDEPFRLSPGIGEKVDQETEVALVMGPGCPRDVSPEDALDYVFGLVVLNDLTVREKQVRMTPDGGIFMVLGASKNFDGATRLSSYVITLDEIPDLYDLPLRTFVNGEMTQNNSTANVIHSFSEIVSYFSLGISLQPGAIITTGTPGGTGWGQDATLGGKGFVPDGCKPARYLQPGDEIRSEVGGVGALTFRVE